MVRMWTMRVRSVRVMAVRRVGMVWVVAMRVVRVVRMVPVRRVGVVAVRIVRMVRVMAVRDVIVWVMAVRTVRMRISHGECLETANSGLYKRHKR